MNTSEEKVLKLNEDAQNMLAALPEAMNASWNFIANIKETLAQRPSLWNTLEISDATECRISECGLVYNVDGTPYLFRFAVTSALKEVELDEIATKAIQKLFVSMALAIHDGSLEEEYHSMSATNASDTVYSIAAIKAPGSTAPNAAGLKVYSGKEDSLDELRKQRLEDFVTVALVDYIMDNYLANRVKETEPEGEMFYEHIVTCNGKSFIVTFDETEKTTEPEHEILAEMRQLVYDILINDDGGVFDFEECGISVMIFNSEMLDSWEDDEDGEEDDE